MKTAATLWGALVTPDKTLADDTAFQTRRAVPLLLILALALSGSFLSLRFSRNPIALDLASREALERLDRMMANAPAQQREEARRRTLEMIQGQGAVIALVGGAVLTVVTWMLTIVQIWLLFILLPQFMGGEEQPVGSRRHRRTQYLALFACLPVAAQELVRGLVYALMDPTRLANVTTLAEYQRAVEVSFSLLYLAGVELRGLGDLARGLIHGLANPFVLWSAYVLIWGGASVLRLKRAKVILVCALVLGLFSAEGALLAALGRLAA